MSVRLVLFDDWEALFDDQGAKLVESDKLSASEVVRALGGSVKFASEIFDMETAHDGVPDHLAEFPPYAFK